MKDIAAPLAQALDGVLPVCTGSSRLSKRWTNTTITWGDLCQRLGKTQRTGETVEQYHAMSKNEKAKVKDVGGIVCGHLKHDKTSDDKTMAGRKTKDNILNRSIVTLDMDECPGGLNPVEIISEKLPGIAAVAYTTHSHTPEAPRWRVFVPLFEWVTPFYYEGIARWVGNELGIEFLDKTTFQYNRLMYWPSTSSDGEYLCQVIDGSPISPRKFYEAYPAMKRESAWPRHPDEEPVEKRSPLHEREGEYSAAGKPGAPAEKPGIIGAFCRAYPIEEAISTFLDEVYKPEGLGRYTYINGSSSGGLIIDGEGKAYSFHATDPANTGHTINAFDLVRLHKFGHLDNGVGGHRGNNLPSYKAMSTWASQDAKVMRLLNQEFIEAVTGSGEDSEALEFVKSLERDNKGNIQKTYKNLQTIMLHDPVLRKTRYNAFSEQHVIEDPQLLNSRRHIIDDGAVVNIAARIEDVYGITISTQRVRETLSGVASRKAYNPVQDYIRLEEWDGTPRLDTILIRCLGAPDSPLVRAQTRKWFIGAVRRAFVPGSKFDYMLVLAGPQGVGKSQFLSIIANDGEFFSDSLELDMKSKELVEHLLSAWIIEVCELAGLYSVKETEKVKSFLSKNSDFARLAWEHEGKDYPRRCALAATTNESSFLSDTSSRKFWVVDVNPTKNFVEWSPILRREVHQLWAEAYAAFKQGEPNFLDPALEEESRKASLAHNTATEDPMLGVIKAYLDYILPAGWRSMSREARRNKIRTYDQLGTELTLNVKRNKICAAEIKNELYDWFLAYDSKRSSQYVNRLLSLTGWKLYDKGKPELIDGIYGMQRKVYHRPGTDGKDLDGCPSETSNRPYRMDEDDDDD